MPLRNLREFVASLEAAGELVRVGPEVSPRLEMAEIVDRLCKRGGPAVLFERPTGYEIPVLMNAFGSARRMALALGADDVEAIRNRIGALLHSAPPTSLAEKVRAGWQLLRLGSFLPKMVTAAPCQEVVCDPPGLDQLPILTCWPQDGGPFITLPLVISRSPETGCRNVGMYRMQVYDNTSTGMHWHVHKVGAKHYREYERRGERMPVAVALGGDPATIYAATAPLPAELDEIMFAGFLRQQPVEMVACQTIDLEVPAEAEIVLEGYVEPHERRREGPFGDHTGYYSLADDYPVFHLTHMTRRREPIYPATVVGPPPMEDCYLGKATERIFLPLLQLALPEIVDLNLPLEGVFHNLALVSIRKEFPWHARKVMHALWGLGQMMFTKVIVVVDDDVDVHNEREVLWKALNHIDPQRDVTFVEGPVDVLDHASARPNIGSKMGIDATRKWPSEGHTREWPDEIKMTPEIKRRVDALWEELGLD